MESVYIPIQVDKQKLPKQNVLCISKEFPGQIFIAAGKLKNNGKNVTCDTDAIGYNVNWITHYLEEQKVLSPGDLEDLYNEEQEESAAPEEFIHWLETKGAKIII